MGNLKLYNLLRCAVGVKQGITVLKRKKRRQEKNSTRALSSFIHSEEKGTCENLLTEPNHETPS